MSVFFPEEEVRSVYDFPFESLTARGIRGIVFDIDNTLVPPDAPVDARCRALIQRRRKGHNPRSLIVGHQTDAKARCL